ncbi:hypothetical protein LCGC14_1295420, partial [marine sediment metagenome]
MKFHIYNPNATYFTKIEQLFTKSLIDIGSTPVSYKDAEVLFCIQHPEENPDLAKHRILLQTEDYKSK